MKNFRNILLGIFSLPLFVFSQELPQETSDGELLLNPEVNAQLFSNSKKENLLKSEHDSLVFLIDTLQLPFVDDFSVNKIKNYNATVNDANVMHIYKYRFDVNGIYMDSIYLMFDTVHNYIYNLATQQYDTVSNMPVTVKFYLNYDPLKPSLLTVPTETRTMWKNISYRWNEFTVDTIILTQDTICINKRDTFHIVPDDDFSLWIDDFAFVNNTYGVNPPTIGVATFDGVDGNGEPYDFTFKDSYGPADKLTSKPIDLAYLPGNVVLSPADSVVFSFYYQPQGFGDFPDVADSLFLEFYSPSENLWNWIWSARGVDSIIAQPVFQEVKIPVTDSKYFQQGFQFRFRNYATLSGLFDHWNIDYVQLDANRTVNTESLQDVAYIYQSRSLVESFSSMPWEHYKSSSAPVVANNNLDVRNLDAQGSFVTNKYAVFDENENSIFTSQDVVNGNLQPGTYTFTMPVKDTPNNFTFPVNSNETYTFKIKNYMNVTPDANRNNDTTVHYQVFNNYYSYDDGSAEKTYALIGAGAKLACKFTIAQPDTLRGVYFYFPYLMTDVRDFTFKIFIWADDNGKPGNVIYQSELLDNPRYSTKINQLIWYEIKPEVYLSGTFYIGWKQTTADKIYLGFDKNTNNQSKIFYNTSGNWSNTQFTGSLMIRPGFGEPIYPAYTIIVKQAEDDFVIYPNPANETFRLSLPLSFRAGIMEIYSLAGEKIFSLPIGKGGDGLIDVSNLPSGIYFVKIQEDDSFVVKKLLISR